jgi:hypothetical protein
LDGGFADAEFGEGGADVVLDDTPIGALESGCRQASRLSAAVQPVCAGCGYLRFHVLLMRMWVLKVGFGLSAELLNRALKRCRSRAATFHSSRILP